MSNGSVGLGLPLVLTEGNSENGRAARLALAARI